jgi:hypothetical protein
LIGQSFWLAQIKPESEFCPRRGCQLLAGGSSYEMDKIETIGGALSAYVDNDH